MNPWLVLALAALGCTLSGAGVVLVYRTWLRGPLAAPVALFSLGFLAASSINVAITAASQLP